MPRDRAPNDGLCRLCESTYTYDGMARHLKNCVVEHVDSEDAPDWFHLRLRAFSVRARECWLQLLVKPSASLRDFDEYLRTIWFHDGSHPSQFRLSGTTYARTPERMGDVDSSAPSMDREIGEVISTSTEIRYRYELAGSQQMIRGKMYGSLPAPASLQTDAAPEGVATLARNQPYTVQCHGCETDEAEFRCIDCFDVPGVCDNCRDDHPNAHRLVIMDNTPVKLPAS